MKTDMKNVFLALLIVGISGTLYAWNPPAEKGKSGEEGNAKAAGCSPSVTYGYLDFNDTYVLIETGGSMWQNRAKGAPAYFVPRPAKSSISGTAITGTCPFFAGALWMAGTDVNGQLKIAAHLFRSKGTDFWTGPLSQDVGSGNYDPTNIIGSETVMKRDFGAATITPDQCAKYDKFFPIKKSDVVQFSAWWECNDTAGVDCVYPDADVINRILNWPAHGDVSIGQAYYLAPFFDRQKDGDEYDPMGDGDYPWYDLEGDIDCRNDRRVTLFGDSTVWWVFNDKGNIHTETGGQPIGMEVHAQAFLFATDDEVNQMTFYNYEMINRGTQTLQNTFFSQYADPDLGGSIDDFVGCDVSRGLGYVYNADNFDENNQTSIGYGANPPAAGIDFFEGPYQDNDGMDNPGPHKDSTGNLIVPSIADARANKGIVYSGLGIGYGDGVVDNERYGMIRFMPFYRSDVGGAIPGINDDPNGASDYYNYMRGRYKDGSRMVYGGTGHVSSSGALAGVYTNYAYPGDSDPYGWGQPEETSPQAPWSEITENNPKGDRRFIQTAGPFTLTPGAVNNITVGVVYARSNESDLLASVRALFAADTKAQALFDNCFQILEPPMAPKLSIQELENELILMVTNPSGNNVNEAYIKEDKLNIPEFDYVTVAVNDSTQTTDTLTNDRFYRFEGYQIYQMVDGKASVSDIGNVDKARLVAQCDISNDVSQLINYEFNEELSVSIPTLKVDGADKGIRHSFKITQDAFASTANALVNHKTYYYIAVAYAHNNFKTYDPKDPTALNGQKTPYLRSRITYNGGNIESVAGIPHNPMPEAGGTYQEVEYGSSPRITRIEGVGNGGSAIDLTQASEDEILKNGFILHPEYEAGAGPINVKVVDPLNVAKGYFVLKFRGYNTISGNPFNFPETEYPSDSAHWVIYHYDKANGTLIDSVSSARTIVVNNEQIIPEWGVSVTISQSKYYFLKGNSVLSYKSLITDPIEATIEYADSSKQWLSGVQDVDQLNPFNWILSGTFFPSDSVGLEYADRNTRDPESNYENLLFKTFTHASLVRTELVGAPIHNNTKLTNAEQAVLNSPLASADGVDFVFTSDKSKWTRCPVIEMCQNIALSQGGAEVSMLRNAPSVDKNGLRAGEPGYNASEGDLTNTNGMGWFPGYAIDVETGKRLNMAFGENSSLVGQQGADMVWNPTMMYMDIAGNYVFGGMHTIYIFGEQVHNFSGLPFSPSYDNGAWLMDRLQPTSSFTSHRAAWGNCMWVAYPTLAYDQELLSNDVRVRIRIKKEYRDYAVSGENGSKPMYTWSTDNMGTIISSDEALADALKLINVVPNPYYAYSRYETTRLDARIKITNLPEICNIKIYNIRGKLIRTFEKDNTLTSQDWDLKNMAGIPVAGGVYLIHVEVPGIGERILKWFGGIRQPDMQNL